MYIQFNKSKGKNGKTYQSVLLCKKYRDKETKKVKTEVILNLSKLGLDNKTLTALQASINKPKGVLVDSESVKVNKSINIGYTSLLVNMMNKLRITETLEKTYGFKTNIIQLMIIGKIVTRGSKLNIFNWIKRNSYLAECLKIDLAQLRLDDLYFELAELSQMQGKIEKKWNVYHGRTHKNIYLYDKLAATLKEQKTNSQPLDITEMEKKGKNR